MSSYTVLPVGFETYRGDAGANTVVVDGVRTVTTLFGLERYGYSYALYDIATMGGDDVVYVRNVTAIDPASVNPRSRQWVDLGDGNDFAQVTSLTAATIMGGSGNDVLWKVDLRSSQVVIENGSITTGPGSYGLIASAIRPDDSWLDFDILDGGDGDDTIVGGNGPDWVFGGAGADNISVGWGNNVVYAGEGADVIQMEGIRAGVVIGGAPPTAENLYAPANNAIWGGGGDDVVILRHMNNPATGLVAVINGDDGNDFIQTQSVSSVWVTGGEGADTISISQDNLNYAYNWTTAQPNDTVWAGAGDDVIYSGHGADLIVAGASHDWVFNGWGSDHVYGGEGGAVGDGASDRHTLDLYIHQNPASYFTTSFVSDVDVIYDFEPQSRFPGQAGRGDVIDLTVMFAASSSDPLVHQAANPFLNGQLRLADAYGDGQSTAVQALDGTGGYSTFLILYGVGVGELDTANAAQISSGLAAKTGGDFFWF